MFRGIFSSKRKQRINRLLHDFLSCPKRISETNATGAFSVMTATTSFSNVPLLFLAFFAFCVSCAMGLARGSVIWTADKQITLPLSTSVASAQAVGICSTSIAGKKVKFIYRYQAQVIGHWKKLYKVIEKVPSDVIIVEASVPSPLRATSEGVDSTKSSWYFSISFVRISSSVYPELIRSSYSSFKFWLMVTKSSLDNAEAEAPPPIVNKSDEGFQDRNVLPTMTRLILCVVVCVCVLMSPERQIRMSTKRQLK